MLKLLTRTIICWAITGLGLALAEDTISIEAAWVRSAPPTVNVMAGYLRLINHSPNNVTVNRISSLQFERVEVHRSVIHEGMMHMEKVESLTLTGHQQLVFEPGGYHLMLIAPHQPLARGANVSLALEFDHGEKLMIETLVKDGPEEDSMGQHGSSHHQH